MLLKNGADVNIQDSYGNTPLWTAIFNSKGHYELTILYLEYCAKLGTVNKAQKTCYDLARALNDKQLLKIIERYRQEIMEVFINDVKKNQYLENLYLSE